VKVRVTSHMTTSKGIIPAGTIIEIPYRLIERLKGKIVPIDCLGEHLSHYCKTGDCWCSEKLTDRDYPSGCIKFKCKYYQPL